MKPRLIDLIGWGGDYGPLTVDGQWWRLVSATFVHAGLFHLVYNLLALAYVSQSVERLLGNGVFALVYLASAIGGSVLALFWNPMIVHVGASGAVFGVYGVLAGFAVVRRDAMPPHLAARMRRMLLIFLAYNALYSLQPGISFAAHLGGLLTGFACALVVGRAPAEATQGLRMRHALTAAGVAVAMVLLGIGAMSLRYPRLDAFARALSRFDAIDLHLPDSGYASTWKTDLKLASDAELADLIDEKVLPAWRDARATVEGYAPVPGPLRDEVATIDDYMRAREDGFVALAAALHRHDKADLESAQDQLYKARGLGRAVWRLPRARVVFAPRPAAVPLTANTKS
jgi:rhomboid protease GluP